MALAFRPAAVIGTAVVLIGAGALSTPAANAQAVYDQYVGGGNLVGSRVLNVNELESGGGVDQPTEITVSWNIGHDLGLTLWTYNYRVAWAPQGSAISHMILDTSNNCTSSSNCVTNATLNGKSIASSALEYGSYSGADSSNPGMGGPITGIKFNVESGTPYDIRFESDRAPVWGDFYTKASNPEKTPPPAKSWYSQNVGINNHASTNILNFVARPDTSSVLLCADGATNFPICSSQVIEVPEPMSMALLGVGLLGLGVVRMRRHRAA